jgi:hypothetical protein
MTESGLSLGVADFRSAVGFQLGYGRTSANWTAGQLSEINEIVQSGIRRTYFPSAISADTVGYEWSWLRPTTTLSIAAPYSTGTIAIVDGIVTLTTGTFPTWISAGDYLSVGSVDYEIASRDNGAQLTLTDLTVDVTAGATYSVATYIYDLPDDFGRLIGSLHYAADKHRKGIVIVSVGKLLQMRSCSDLKGAPTHAAYRYKSSTGASGQRQEILFYPEPDAIWVLSYEYEAFTGQLTDTYPYPLGGMKYGELYLESCLAVVESRIEDIAVGDSGIHTQQFSTLLIDAIARDRKHGAQNYGPMGQPETHDGRGFRRGWGSGSYQISYGGEPYGTPFSES